MHLLIPLSGSEVSFGVGLHCSALAPPTGIKANDSKSEDGISDFSKSYSTRSYLSGSYLFSDNDRGDSLMYIADDRKTTNNNGGSIDVKYRVIALVLPWLWQFTITLR